MLEKSDMTETLVQRIKDACIYLEEDKNFRQKGQCKVPLLKLAR